MDEIGDIKQSVINDVTRIDNARILCFIKTITDAAVNDFEAYCQSTAESPSADLRKADDTSL